MRSRTLHIVLFVLAASLVADGKDVKSEKDANSSRNSPPRTAVKHSSAVDDKIAWNLDEKSNQSPAHLRLAESSLNIKVPVRDHAIRKDNWWTVVPLESSKNPEVDESSKVPVPDLKAPASDSPPIASTTSITTLDSAENSLPTWSNFFSSSGWNGDEPWEHSKPIRILLIIMVSLAFVEFFTYTITFLYGLIKAVIMSNHTSTRVTGAAMMVVWLFVRGLYLPFLYSNVPADVPQFPVIVEEVSFITITALFPLLLFLPLIAGIYYSIKFGVGFEEMDDKHITGGKPTIIVIMPIYNEDPDALWRAVSSIINSKYPSEKIHIFLSFDDEAESSLHRHLMICLGYDMPSYPKIMDLTRGSIKITVSRFEHGGKRTTQAKTFQIVQTQYSSSSSANIEPHVLFLDSDIILAETAIHNFVCSIIKEKNLVAMTGYITCLTKGTNNRKFLTFLQDVEYMTGQLFNRSLESALGGVTCLPGALTMIRLSSLEAIAPRYFTTLDTTRTFHYHRYHLGEDRYLTHLLMELYPRYSVGFCFSARCKTEAPDTWGKYCKQRRRWLLGAIANEVFMLISPSIWRKFPFLSLYKLLDFSTRSVSFYMFIFIVYAILGYRFETWQMLAIFGPLILVWALVMVYSVLLKRFKLTLMYPWMLFCNPIIYIMVNFYAIYTWSRRTWGGPRVKESIFTTLTRTLTRSLNRKARKIGTHGSLNSSNGQINIVDVNTSMMSGGREGPRYYRRESRRVSFANASDPGTAGRASKLVIPFNNERRGSILPTSSRQQTHSLLLPNAPHIHTPPTLQYPHQVEEPDDKHLSGISVFSYPDPIIPLDVMSSPSICSFEREEMEHLLDELKSVEEEEGGYLDEAM